MAGGDKEGPVPSGGAGEPGPKPKDGNGLGFVVISQIEQNIPLSFSVMSQPSQGLGAVCQQIQTGRHTVLKGGTRPHPFGSLLLQPWRKWRKKQGWTEANGGNSRLLTWLQVHPLLLLFPPSLSKSNPTGLDAKITTQSAHSSLLNRKPQFVLTPSSSTHQLIPPPSRKPPASFQNETWPLKGWQEQPS